MYQHEAFQEHALGLSRATKVFTEPFFLPAARPFCWGAGEEGKLGENMKHPAIHW